MIIQSFGNWKKKIYDKNNQKEEKTMAWQKKIPISLMVSISHPTPFKLYRMCDLTKNELELKLVFFGGKILQLGKIKFKKWKKIGFIYRDFFSIFWNKNN